MKLEQRLLTSMPIVFTAQSKAFFYCRDAVCQYVLSREAIPINPFRVFDYFLNERVERDIVRRGNNNLIRVTDELWVFGESIADGVMREILYARDLGKPIRYFTIDSLVERIQPTTVNRLTFEREVYNDTKLTKDQLMHLLRHGQIADDSTQTKLF